MNELKPDAHFWGVGLDVLSAWAQMMPKKSV